MTTFHPGIGRPSISDRLLDVPASDAWRTLALCAGMDPEVFFDLSLPYLVAQARTFCDRCPVRISCLEYAIDAREEVGMWGGKTPTERDYIRVTRKMRRES